MLQRICHLVSISFFVILGACSSFNKGDQKAKNAEMLYELGLSSYNDGRYPDSVAYLLQAKAAEPERIDIPIQLGLAYLKLDRSADAEREIHAACLRAPQSAECWNNLAVVDLKMKDPHAALENAQKALTIVTYATPELALANLAQAQMQLGQYSAAHASLGRAEHLAPENCQLKILLCGVLIKEQSFEDGLREAKMAASLCPGSSSAHLWEAYSYYKMGERDRAHRKYEKIMKQFHESEVQTYGMKALDALQNRIPIDLPPL